MYKMKLTGRVSLEELNVYAHTVGFNSWDSYKLTLSDLERRLVFNIIYEERKEHDNVNFRITNTIRSNYH